MNNDFESAQGKKKRIIANILLISTTILWGSSFIITKNLTQNIPIFLYLGIRFFIAFVGFCPYFIRFKKINKRVLFLGFLTGLIYYFGIFFQTWGIQTTTAGKTAFITGLSTIMVPFIIWIGFKKKLNKRIWIAVIISVVGMGFLLLEGASGIIRGRDAGARPCDCGVRRGSHIRGRPDSFGHGCRSLARGGRTVIGLCLRCDRSMQGG